MSFTKGHRKIGGRTKGTPNVKIQEARELCRRLVGDADYQDNFLARLRKGKLPPAVECMVWHYAYGRPPDELLVTGEETRPLRVVFGGRYAPDGTLKED